MKSTIIVAGRHAMRVERLEVARAGRIGVSILGVEHLAARLAGGFLRAVDGVELREAAAKALETVEIGELEPIRDLPGMASACAGSIQKLWLADISLEGEGLAPRLQALRAIEQAALAQFPAAARRPKDLVAAALGRLELAPRLVGPVTIKGLTELHPVWRHLLIALADHVEVTWEAGPRRSPEWLAGSNIQVLRSEPAAPALPVVSCATARHEMVEALRWMRETIACGAAKPNEVAIAAASLGDYDDHFAALAADANLCVHAAQGMRAVLTRDGQAAAALADILLRGLSQTRMRRLFALERPDWLEDGWDADIPRGAALTEVLRWRRAFEQAGRLGAAGRLLSALGVLERGAEAAREAGEAFLSGRALALWERALVDGPADALDTTLLDLRVDDDVDPLSSPVFLSAAALASTPRRFVRLLGLTSRAWPRSLGEDALVPDHVVPADMLDPLPAGEADRRDFESICLTTGAEVVLSFARRDEEGRALGLSPLVPQDAQVTRLGAGRRAGAAMSEADRVFARPAEFAATAHGVSSEGCWRDWRSSDLTEHDGLVRENHPRVLAALDRVHSATSLRTLLRDPLGFVWRYALGFKAPDEDGASLTLDALVFGSLLHDALRRATEALGPKGGLLAGKAAIQEAVREAVEEVRVEAEDGGGVPPGLLWRQALATIAERAEAALLDDAPALKGQTSHAEVPFGLAEADGGAWPWDETAPVAIPGTTVRITGFIDRLDLSAARDEARVVDYKSGKTPTDLAERALKGGSELQRCLYAYAVRALLKPPVTVASALLYHEGRGDLADPDVALKTLTAAILAARGGASAGACLPGEDAFDRNDLAFALPSGPALYRARKGLAFASALAPVAAIWDQP